MKKTNKENPITSFRKANEARKGVVKRSLVKAQEGIAQEISKYATSPWKNPLNPSSIDYKNIMHPENIMIDNAKKMHEKDQQTYKAQGVTKKLSNLYTRPITNRPIHNAMFKKQGGAIKRKK